MSKLIGDELVVSVFAQYAPKSTFRITDESDIITAFYNAKMTGQYNSLFDEYPFDADGIEPTCYEISEALTILQQSRLLGRMNPDLVNYTISPAMKISYDKFISKKIKGTTRRKIKELAEYIKSQLEIKNGDKQVA